MALERLEEISWSNLVHARGLAVDTPSHLRKLASTDPSDREEAYDNLAQTIWNNGTVYEAALPAVQFLAELLDSDETPDKGLVLQLLRLLVEGGGWHVGHRDLLAVEDQRDTPEYKGKMKQELAFVNKLQEEIVSHLRVYTRLLRHPEKGTRISTLNLLTSLLKTFSTSMPDLRAEIVPEIDRRLNEETDQQVRTCIWRGLLEICPIENFQRPWRDEENELCRCIALMIQVLLTEDQVSKEDLDRLARYLHMLYGERRELKIQKQIAILLSNHSPEYAEIILPLLLDEVKRVSWDGDFFNTLLTAALGPQGQRVDLEELSGNQKEAIKQVAVRVFNRYEWDRSAVNVLKRFGLPCSRDEMKKLLGLECL